MAEKYKSPNANPQYKSPNTANNPTPKQSIDMLINAFNRAKKIDPHTALDVAGMVPVLGMPADVTNAALYASKGDKVGAGLSMAAALPAVGLGGGASKLIKRLYDKFKDKGVEGLNRIEKQYLARHMEDFEHHKWAMDKKNPYYELDYPEEHMNELIWEHEQADRLEHLYRTMVRGEKSLMSKSGQARYETEQYLKSLGKKADFEREAKNFTKNFDKSTKKFTQDDLPF
jgi:hypothetical protein